MIEDSATCVCIYEKYKKQEELYKRYIAYKVTYKCGCGKFTQLVNQNETARVEDEIRYSYTAAGITKNVIGATGGAFDSCSCGSVGEVRANL